MNRKFLLGLGSGLIIGSLLMQLMHLGQTPPATSTLAPLPSDWKEQATELGYMVYTKEEMKPNKDTSENTTDVVKQAVIYIPSGFNSSQVAQMLKEAGVIEDAEQLQKQLDVSGLSRRIQVGTYTFAIPSSIEEISKTITHIP
jgi:rhodanese-related sulfurtransferase